MADSRRAGRADSRRAGRRGTGPLAAVAAAAGLAAAGFLLGAAPARAGGQQLAANGWTPPWSDQAQPQQQGYPQGGYGQGSYPQGSYPQGGVYAPEPIGTGLLNPAGIGELQQELAARGFYAGAPDGVVGPQTISAIRRYQAAAGLPMDGLPTAELLAHLRYAQPVARSVSPPPGQALGSTGRPPLGHVQGAVPDVSFAFIEQVQIELMKHGFNPGPVDGLLGQRTRAAVSRYQARAGLPVTGEITLDLLNHLKFVRPPIYAAD